MWRTGLPGPCALAAVTWEPLWVARRVVVLAQTLAAATIVAMATVGAAIFVALPLARRIEALSVAARSFGTPDWKVPAVDGDLGRLATVLDEAHARVLRDRAQDEADRRALERHLADVAHDLRTPLASLQLRLEALTGRVDPALLEAAVADVVSIGLLTGNLQLVARIRAGSREAPPSTDLNAIAERVRTRVALFGGRRGVEVDGSVPDEPTWVRAEEVHLEQLVANLAHNAVVHHPGPGHVAIVVRHDGTRFELRVADDGPGLPDAARAALADPSLRPLDGHGLGLAIVAELCRAAGWTLDVETTGGTSIRITGPRAP